MSVAAIEPATSAPQNRIDLLVGKNYELKLNQSMQNLFAEIHEETLDLSHFIHVFYELMQAKLDPPLESIWVYAGLTFRSRNPLKDDLLDRMAASKELFQLLSSCSVSCGSSKCIALLTPVVFEVYKLVVKLFGKDLALKRERKAMREIMSLVEGILGYIIVCCSKDSIDEWGSLGSNSTTSFAELVRIWIGSNNGIEAFLPLLSGETIKWLSDGKFCVGQLAGVVIAEVFLLELCLKFRAGIAREELRSWAVGSISGFRSFFFFETLVRILLERVLAVTSLLSSEDEVLLRNVLYDAVILVEYSFLSPERAISIPAEHMKCLAMARLIITYEAIELFRGGGDQKRAISYIDAFSNSLLPSQIIKWGSSQIVLEEKLNISSGSSPKALIKWLLNLEDRGIKVFDDSISKYRTKLVLDVFKADLEQPASKLEDQKVDDDTLFTIDNNGADEDTDEDKMEQSMSAAFVAAAHTMKLAENGGRKRKEGRSAENQKIKFVKYDLCQNSVSVRARSTIVRNDGSDSESEVENPISDEDTETKEF
ncbi:hypothetical protein I3842_04G151400 [Carya illinoinensis]|uniref:Uncharacterized protein n=1 Tax=Carya illinoinensis TaxID=32201 RepID=A0A922JVB9_CARIL|nr:hypothetical protein I3842_04G151400 [Carya illinoinensis]KAG6718465.1 hypothetical protein I3842_04G151400 [Carya illinoinensis]